MINLSQLSIYRNLSSEPKRKRESEDIVPFLMSVGDYVPLEDVEFGAEPPDFVFRCPGKSIGVELTELNPKVFSKGGYALRKEFKLWQKETDENPQAHHEFPWGCFSVRESLAAFAQQFDGKCKKVIKWRGVFSEKWLVAHVGNGSPFGSIFPGRGKVAPGREEEMANYKAKMLYSLFSICQRPHPFDYIILFCGRDLFPFPANNKNPYRFPVAKPEVLEIGARVSDQYLDWSSTLKSVTEHLSLEELTKRIS